MDSVTASDAREAIVDSFHVLISGAGNARTHPKRACSQLQKRRSVQTELYRPLTARS